jgi:chemotaxis-related protein WspD
MTLNDCWNHIGIAGDGSCPELAKAIHCRNCPTYAAAANRLLDRALPEGYLQQWAEHFARPEERTARGSESVVVFRIGEEWLALPARTFTEVCERRPVHSLPHRRSRVVLGLVNVRGELLICVSLGTLLAIAPGPSSPTARERLLVVSRDGERLVFPVDEVAGIHRFESAQLLPPPTTVAKSAINHTRAILSWEGHAVGVLAEDALFDALNHSLL